MKKIRYMIVAAAVAATAAQAATSILWDINTETEGIDATSPWDFINAGVEEDITAGTVTVVSGSPNTAMTNATGDVILSYVGPPASGTYQNGNNTDPIIHEYIYQNNNGPIDMQIAGLTNHLSPSTNYKFYIWGAGDSPNQGSTFIFNDETQVTSTLDPDGQPASLFMVQFTFATGSTVSNTLVFTWDDPGNYAGFNGFAIVEDDGSTPPVTDLAPAIPGAPYTVISNMAVRVAFAASATGTEPITYTVKRAAAGETNYVEIGSTTDTSYVDTTVATNANYDYVVSAANAVGVSGNSDAVAGTGFPYDILGANTSYGESLDRDNLFDNDISTFFDTKTPNNGWVGVDFGEGNAKQVESISYVCRDWGWRGVEYSWDAVFEGANQEDFSDAVILHTVPATIARNPLANIGIVVDTTAFRFIRLRATNGRPLYSFAELDFITADQVTAEGTWFEWLDYYYDVSGANPSNFADYAEADYSDTDGDGLLAYQEYKLNGDPTDANSPAGTANVYAWPEAPLENVVRWDESVLADVDSGGGYIVYRSMIDSNYMPVMTVFTNVYNDADVTAGETYYYKVSATNASAQYESALSATTYSVANEYQIFGEMKNAGASLSLWFYNLFDRDRSTFLDDNAEGGYAGLDYGAGNGQVITEVYFNLRNDDWGTTDNGNVIVIDGVTNAATRAQYFAYGNTFEGSNSGDTNDYTVLATITNMIPLNGEWNAIPVADTTAYQYVRYNNSASGKRNYAMADVEFLTADDFTAKGTPILWLEENGLTASDDELDTDTDGHEAWQEFLAYTDPVDSNSVLKVNSFSLTNGMVITWNSIEGKSYSVMTNTSLSFGTPGVEETVIGLDGETSYTGTVSGASSVFYDIGVE